jgi:hypothetical protein
MQRGTYLEYVPALRSLRKSNCLWSWAGVDATKSLGSLDLFSAKGKIVTF